MRALIFAFPIPLVLAACLAPLGMTTPQAARDYADYCASCHGDGRTPGPLAQEIGLKPVALADLTAMNEGVFPEAMVMSKITGYREHGQMVGAQAGDMPAFEDLTGGPVVLYDSGDGIATPTPLRLVELMEYVKGLGS